MMFVPCSSRILGVNSKPRIIEDRVIQDPVLRGPPVLIYAIIIIIVKFLHQRLKKEKNSFCLIEYIELATYSNRHYCQIGMPPMN